MQQQRQRLGAFGAFVLLVALHGSLALPPTKEKDSDNAPFANCPVQHVDKDHPVTYVTLEDNLTFVIQPSESLMYIRILLDHILYKATVTDTLVELFKCEEGQESRCTMVDESGTKDSSLLLPNQWNRVLVTLTDSKIGVHINMKANVMGVRIGSQERPSKILVSIVAHDPGTASHQHDYSLLVNIQCNDTYIPQVVVGDVTAPKGGSSGEATTTAHPPTDPAPFPKCPLYEVGPDQPLPPVTVDGSLSMAVYPSHSNFYMTLRLNQTLYKASVKGTMVELVKCDSESLTCTSVDEGGTKDSDLLNPQQWNLVRITMLNYNITVDINMKANVMVMSFESDDNVGQATVLVPDTTDQKVMVNIQCNDTYTPDIHPVLTTGYPPATSEPIVDTSPEPVPQHRPVGLIVGLLVGLLFLTAVVVAVYYYKKRSSADINQHTPLCEQQQQQQQK